MGMEKFTVKVSCDGKALYLFQTTAANQEDALRRAVHEVGALAAGVFADNARRLAYFMARVEFEV